MPTSARNKKRNKEDVICLRFPDKGDFDTIEQYDEAVKMYWDVIDAYCRMASEFYHEIMKEKARVRNKHEKRVNQET